MPTIELINTGSELMLGRVLNTHQQWLCRQLSDAGYTVDRQVAVADTGPAIEGAVREALRRSDWVITTGGLGPTSDDLTRERIAALLGLGLCEHAETLDRLRGFYESRRRPVPVRTLIQAQVPVGAQVLTNDWGTAPGLLLHVAPNPFRSGGGASWLAMLPGPPRELRPLFTERLLPALRRCAPLDQPYTCRILRTTGLAESLVEERVAPALESLIPRGLEVGYCARPGEVDVRLAARGEAANEVVAQASAAVEGLLAKHWYGTGDEELEEVVVRRLQAAGATLAVAESCTGGHLGDRITRVSGASAVFLGGWITYSNAAKEQQLGVRATTLAAHGAVSEAVAREMAEGARQRSGARYALATTGIAGPTGGTPDKPVGTVFVALATPGRTVVLNPLNAWDRATFKRVTTQQALDLLRRVMAGE